MKSSNFQIFKSSNLQILKFPHFQIFKFSNLQIIFLLLMLISCSPQRRLQRLVVRHPELRLTDTVLVADTLFTAAITADTAIPLTRLIDTVVIACDKLEIKLVKIRDTIHVTGTCKADTIVREVRVPVERIKLVKTEARWLSKVLWIVAGLVVASMVWKFGTRDTRRGT